MEKFKLIQTGYFLPDGATNHLRSLISFHYMGAAEFEGDALADSLKRIFKHYPKYKLLHTGILGKDNLELMVFTKNILVPNMIAGYIQNPYELKQITYLEKVPYIDVRLKDKRRVNQYGFWWCIDNSDPRALDFYSSIGDWMACFSDDAPRLTEAIKNTFS